MKLRKECEHGRYDAHKFNRWGTHPTYCPGGEFLADDALLVGEVIQRLVLDVTDYALSRDQEQAIAKAVLDALTVREGVE